MTGPAPALLGTQPSPVPAANAAGDPDAFARALGAQMAPLGEEVEPSPRAAGPGVPPKKRAVSPVDAAPPLAVPIPAATTVSLAPGRTGPAPAPDRFGPELVAAATPAPSPAALERVLSDAGARIAVETLEAPRTTTPVAAPTAHEAREQNSTVHRGDPPIQDPPPEDGEHGSAGEHHQNPSKGSGAEDSGSPSTLEYGPTVALPAPAAAAGPAQPPQPGHGGFIEAWKPIETPVAPWVPDAIRVTVQDTVGRWEVDVHRRHDVVDMVVRGDVGLVPIVRAVETELRAAMDGSGSSLGQFSFEQQDQRGQGGDARREEAPEWQPPPHPRPSRSRTARTGLLDRSA